MELAGNNKSNTTVNLVGPAPQYRKSESLHGVQIIIISSCFYVSLFHAYLNKHMVSPAKLIAWSITVFFSQVSVSTSTQLSFTSRVDVTSCLRWSSLFSSEWTFALFSIAILLDNLEMNDMMKSINEYLNSLAGPVSYQ